MSLSKIKLDFCIIFTLNECLFRRLKVQYEPFEIYQKDRLRLSFTHCSHVKHCFTASIILTNELNWGRIRTIILPINKDLMWDFLKWKCTLISLDRLSLTIKQQTQKCVIFSQNNQKCIHVKEYILFKLFFWWRMHSKINKKDLIYTIILLFLS